MAWPVMGYTRLQTQPKESKNANHQSLTMPPMAEQFIIIGLGYYENGSRNIFFVLGPLFFLKNFYAIIDDSKLSTSWWSGSILLISEKNLLVSFWIEQLFLLILHKILYFFHVFLNLWPMCFLHFRCSI